METQVLNRHFSGLWRLPLHCWRSWKICPCFLQNPDQDQGIRYLKAEVVSSVAICSFQNHHCLWLSSHKHSARNCTQSQLKHHQNMWGKRYFSSTKRLRRGGSVGAGVGAAWAGISPQVDSCKNTNWSSAKKLWSFCPFGVSNTICKRSPNFNHLKFFSWNGNMSILSKHGQARQIWYFRDIFNVI